MELPDCLDCKYAEQGHPCRTAAGGFDFTKVGGAVVLHGRTFAKDDDAADFDEAEREVHAWAGDCAFEVEQDYPQLLLPLTIAAMDACETSRDAAYVAAGLLENAIIKHGPLLIGSIEKLAGRSAKFRYFLSAISGERHADPNVWARVCKAVGSSGRMDTDGRTPSAGGPATVLSDREVNALLKERVALTAAALQI